MHIRTQLRDLLVERLPDTWDVRADARDVDALEPDHPAVLIMSARITPGPGPAWRTHEVLVRVLSPLTDPEQVDDDLDDLLDTLTDALVGLDPLTWTEAVRGVHGDRLHCWTLTLTAPARKDA